MRARDERLNSVRHMSKATTAVPLAIVLLLGLAMVIGTSETTASAAVPTASVSKSKPPGIYTLLGITCRTANDCNAVGKNNPGDIAVVRTTDGGAKWQIDSAPKVPLYLESVACPTATNCVAVGYAGSGGGYTPVAVHSTDGGTKWEAQTLPFSSGLLFGVACKTSLDCEAVGTVDTATSSTPVALGTTSGGASWQSQTVPLADTLFAVACPTAETCEAVGGTGSGPTEKGVSVRTTNGGASWRSK